jgi:hypothetical protein
LSLKSKVASASRLQTESKLSKRDQEIKELKNIHKQQLEEGQKVLAEMQSQSAGCLSSLKVGNTIAMTSLLPSIFSQNNYGRHC